MDVHKICPSTTAAASSHPQVSCTRHLLVSGLPNTPAEACRKQVVINSSSSSSSSGIAAAYPPPLAAVLPTTVRSRRLVVTHAWFQQQQTTQRLWDYDGSAVKQLSLRELELLHRLSFGHRNQRSYLVVLHKPDSPACQAFEAEVERLASGLRHEPAFVAAALDVSGSEAAAFVSNMLQVDSVPSVLLYPEAARGCLKFLGPDMSAVGMLAAINKARKAALPAAAGSPGAADWRLIEAATPLTVTAIRAAAASGDREAVVAALQQQMQPIQPTPLAVQQAADSWAQGRVQLWGGLLLCSLLFLAWDLKLSDWWEDWCLSRRQAARVQGRKFTPQENLDDIVTYMMQSLAGQVPLQQQQAEGLQQMEQLQAQLQKQQRRDGASGQQQDQQQGMQSGAQREGVLGPQVGQQPAAAAVADAGGQAGQQQQQQQKREQPQPVQVEVLPVQVEVLPDDRVRK